MQREFNIGLEVDAVRPDVEPFRRVRSRGGCTRPRSRVGRCGSGRTGVGSEPWWKVSGFARTVLVLMALLRESVHHDGAEKLLAVLPCLLRPPGSRAVGTEYVTALFGFVIDGRVVAFVAFVVDCLVSGRTG